MRQPPQNTIAGAWAAFLSIAVPHDAPPIQRQEMRRAFYAGAQSFLDVLMRDLDPDAEPTDADMDRMTGMANELADFGRAIQRGEA